MNVLARWLAGLGAPFSLLREGGFVSVVAVPEGEADSVWVSRGDKWVPFGVGVWATFSLLCLDGGRGSRENAWPDVVALKQGRFSTGSVVMVESPSVYRFAMLVSAFRFPKPFRCAIAGLVVAVLPIAIVSAVDATVDCYYCQKSTW